MVYHFSQQLPGLRLHLQQYLQTCCLLCGCSLEGGSSHFGLCHFCHCALPFIDGSCRQCGIPLPVDQPACGECLHHPPAFDQTCCPTTYTGVLPALVHRFKSGHSNALQRLLAELLVTKIRPCQASTPPVDIVVPVPMHWRRNLQRGNNHGGLLANAVARQLGLPAEHRLLQRTQATAAQKQLDAELRRRNLNQAFRCTANLKGMHIAVVDDVMTTGSTLQAVALTLKQAGAAKVHCWVVARTPKLSG